MERAVAATTVGELYDAARAAQAAGEWNDDHAAWCRVLRDRLGAAERVTVLQLALLEAELGAKPLEVA
jgi:hypothetical protein